MAPRRQRAAEGAATLDIEGAAENNLENVSVSIPLDSLVGVVGPSGSGKTSLVHGVVARIARRRWERICGHLSALAPAYGPRVRAVSRLPCAVELRQEPLRGSARSTVATYSGLARLLAQLFASHGTQLGDDGKPLKPIDPRQVIDWARVHHGEEPIELYRIMAANSMVRGSALSPAINRYAFRDQSESWEFLDRSEFQSRLPAGHGWLAVHTDTLAGRALTVDRLPEGDFILRVGQCVVLDSTHHRLSPSSPMPLQRLTPRLFSTNATAFGSDRCPRCEGLGEVGGLSENALVGDPKAPLFAGGLVLPRAGERFLHLGVLDRILRGLLHSRGYPLDAAWTTLDPETKKIILEGTGQPVPELKVGETRLSKGKGFPGILALVQAKAASPGPAAKVFLAFVTRGPCPKCAGLGLGPSARAASWNGISYPEIAQASVEHAHSLLVRHDGSTEGRRLHEAVELLNWLRRFDVGYLPLHRATATLSGGEGQRLRLGTILSGHARQVLLVLDEPCRGLHPRDTDAIVEVLRAAVSAGNSLLVVEHNPSLIAASDHIVALGPGGGTQGGRVIYEGPPGPYLDRHVRPSAAESRLVASAPLSSRSAMICITGLTRHNVRGVDLAFPVGCLSLVIGPAGSGKSSAVLRGLLPAVQADLAGTLLPLCRRIEVPKGIGFAEGIEQQLPPRSSRSTVATALGLMDELREHYAALASTEGLPYPPSYFSFNTAQGACPACCGLGHSPSASEISDEPCHLCGGMRLRPEVLTVRSHGHSLGDLLTTSVEQLLALSHPAFGKRSSTTLLRLAETGLDHLALGRALSTLSGGERKRVGLVRFQVERVRDRSRGLLVLDEPSTGLHAADVQRLYGMLSRLAHDHDQTLVVIEHHPSALRHADWIVELGPGAGPDGGRLLHCGGRAAFLAGDSPSARYFRKLSAPAPRSAPASANSSRREKSFGVADGDASPEVLLGRAQADDGEVEAWERIGSHTSMVSVTRATPSADARVWEVLDLLPGLHSCARQPDPTAASSPVLTIEQLAPVLASRPCGFLAHAALEASNEPALCDLGPAVATLRRLGYGEAIVNGRRIPLSTLPVALRTASELRQCLIVHPRGEEGRPLIETTLRWSGGTLALLDREHVVTWASVRRISATGRLGARFGDPHVGDIRSPIGQCDTCLGRGVVPTYDVALVVRDASKSIADPGFLTSALAHSLKGALRQEIVPSARAFSANLVADLRAPLEEMDAPTRIAFEHGLRRQLAKASSKRSDRESDWHRWRGLHEYVYRFWSRLPDEARAELRRSYREVPCPVCDGSGLGWEAREVTIGGRELCYWLTRGSIGELASALGPSAPRTLALAQAAGQGEVRLGEKVGVLEQRTSVLLQLAQVAAGPLLGVILQVPLRIDSLPRRLARELELNGVLLESV